MDSRRLVLRAVASIVCCAMLWPTGTLAASFSEFVDPNPAPGNQFGTHVVALSTGNVVITSPGDDAGGTDVGAVYLFNGATGALISTLRGSTPGDQVGSGGVTALSNSNYVVHSPHWNNGAAANAGAVTWGSGVTGVAGVVSAANSLIGSKPGDEVGGVHYDTATGKVGVTPLSNGNYVVASAKWDNGAVADAGAVTWGNGVTGVSGVVSVANSLVGSRAGDEVGGVHYYEFTGKADVTPLSNGNYVVASRDWDNGAVVDAGAVTWGSGTTGVKGVVSAANSLVGSTAGDRVGGAYHGATALTNGNYVVLSPNWDNGAIVDAGAATWGSGTTGVSGVVSAANSLIGSTADDHVGNYVVPLTNGNYVVGSYGCNNGGAVDGGAATWGDGTTGVSGVVSAANSLVGSTADDHVGRYVLPLTNGNYVVGTSEWDNGGVVDAGAATWGDGTTGVSGVISAANSLVGSTAGDKVGNVSVLVLSNGNYVVVSDGWDKGGVVDAGAATWGNGTTGVSGVVSAANSLVGSRAGDAVGTMSATALSNGNYVVVSPWWDNGGAVDAGAVTWCDGTIGRTGVVSAANSLVGSNTYDYVGGFDPVTALPNGNYVVISTYWHNSEGQGAVTWGSGTTGLTGVVSAANSLVGSTYSDLAGSRGNGNGYGVTTFSNGDYVVSSYWWDNGAIVDAGAATWGDGMTGVSGEISAANSLVGSTSNADMHPIVADDVNHTVIASFPAEGGGRVRVGPVKATTAVGGGIPLAFALEGARPNPTSGSGLHVAFTLPTGGYARLQLLDVSGRRVLEREVGSLGAGRHTVNLAAGRKVVPGVYWVRLVQGASQRTACVAVIE